MENIHLTNKTTSGEKMKMKKMTKLFKNQKGLTLVELLAVIVILAIVAAIAVPAIGGVIDNSRYNAVKADATNVLNAAQLYYVDTPSATTAVTVSVLIAENYLESAGKIPTDATVSTKPHTLTTTAIEYSNSKKVKFTSATLEKINNDKLKGSSSGDKEIK